MAPSRALGPRLCSFPCSALDAVSPGEELRIRIRGTLRNVARGRGRNRGRDRDRDNGYRWDRL